MERAAIASYNTMFRSKLNIPFSPKGVVLRTRLIDELDRALQAKLTLVTAPAGYGKTTAVAAWARQAGIPVVWFSLDAHDNNAKRFWSYVIAALEPVLPGVAGLFPQVVYTADPDTAEPLVAALVDEMARAGSEFVLVLDDYHLVRDAAIHESLHTLIQYMPSHAHVLVIGRSSPPFLSARFEMSGDVRKIGIQALRFEAAEIERFSRAYDIQLSGSELNLLEDVIDGWAAGLRLVFDSLARDQALDLSSLAAGPEWDSHKIAAYLMEEVIGSCSEEERAFMQKTSIVSHLCGSLCDELTGRTDGQAMLERLSQHNAFVLPVDREGKWYRYHHLFAEFLQAMLAGPDRSTACDLHEKAGDWYLRNRFIEEAAHHYLQCNRTDRIAAIVEQHGRQLLKTGDFAILKQWLSGLPPDRVKQSDALCLTYAWALMLSGSYREAETWLSVLEDRYLGPDGPPVESDEARKKQIEFEIHYFRSLAGLWTDDRERILVSISRMKELVNENVTIDFSLNVNTGEASLVAGMLGFKGRIRLLDEYVPLYEVARRDVVRRNIGFIPALLGEMHFERNQADEAFTYLIKALDEAERAQMPGSFIPATITLARILKARGDLAGTRDLIADAEIKLAGMGRGHFQPILSAFKARLGIECEDNEAVDSWLRSHEADLHETPSIYRIYRQITLARVLIYRKDPDSAILLLNRLLVLVRKEDNPWYQVEIQNLLAIAYDAAGQTQKAMETLQDSLVLGERDGYARHFIEEGMAMAALLGRLLRKYNAREPEAIPSVSPLYLRKLLAETKAYCLTIKAFVVRKDPGRAKPTGPIQPLTKREKEILRFISSDLTNLEIARTLDISLQTVKVHCTALYRKLQVRNREQAATRAREQNLLA